jgi:selenocysteine lyase/cysteine desulfurase
MPDMFESGTLNLAGIAGLRAGVSYILEQGIDRIHKRIEALTRRLLSNLSKIKGVSVYGQRTGGSSTGVVAFNIAGHSSSDIGRLLNEYYDIAIRVGLHCSPQCHRTIGTYPGGCVRASIGYFNTVAEIDALGKALCRIAG